MMKGMACTNFSEGVEEPLGDEVMDTIIEASHLLSGKRDTTVGTYDHTEILQLVTALSVEPHIHIEVRKLSPDAELPSFDCRRIARDQFERIYRSSRPLKHILLMPYHIERASHVLLTLQFYDRVIEVRTQFRKFFTNGRDIRILGVLFVISGTIDLFWIMSYPDYALKVYGTTFEGWQGAFVKYQHPIIHWIIGYGFWNRQRWAYWTYLAYLGLACFSEITTQIIEGYHPTRMTMIVVSVLFGAYIISRRNVFQSSSTLTAKIS